MRRDDLVIALLHAMPRGEHERGNGEEVEGLFRCLQKK